MNAPVDHVGDAASDFRAVYRRYHRLVWWVVQGSGVPEAWVEDVVQDAFLTIHRRLPETGDDTSMRPWVIGIARNAAFSHRRGAARRQARQSAVPVPERPSAVDSIVAYRHAWDQVHDFLGELEDEQREAFVLCDLQGVAPVEVADALQISRNTVYSRLRLARTKLVDHFSERPRAELPGFLRVARRQGQPTAQHRRRTWAALVLKLPLVGVGSTAGIGTTAGLGAWWVAGKATLVSVAVAGVTLGAIGLVGRAMSGPPGEGPSVTSRSDSVSAGPDAAQGPLPTARSGAATRTGPASAPLVPTAAASDPVSMGATASLDPAAIPPTGATPSGAASTSSVTTPPGPTDPAGAATGSGAAFAPSAPSLEDDVGLLRRATRQLEQGHSTEALATIEHHAREYPASALATERLGLHVRALCAAGSTREAEALAARYVSEHPQTRLAAMLATPCPPPT